LPFKTLYKRRQAEADWLPLAWYVDDAHSLSWVNGNIQIKRTAALPKSHLRGLIIQHKPNFMPHALECKYTIFIAAGLSREMERIVLIKELMHLYFGPDGGGAYATDSQVVLENHMQEMFASSADIRSHQYRAETRALWMSIAVLTPETSRLRYQAAAEKGNMTVEDVADELHIPHHTANALLSHRYTQEISSILE